MTLINNNQERLVKQIEGLSKNLKSSHPRFFALEPTDAIPGIKEYETQRHEMVDITLQVQALLDQGIQPGKNQHHLPRK